MSSLDVSKCTVLEIFTCYDNDIRSLDVSKNTKLAIFSFGDNYNLDEAALLETLHSNTIAGGKTIYVGSIIDYQDASSSKWDVARNKGWTVRDGNYY